MSGRRFVALAFGVVGLVVACGETGSDAGFDNSGADSGATGGSAGANAGGSAGSPDGSPVGGSGGLGGSAGSVNPDDGGSDADAGGPKNVAWVRTVASQYGGGLVDIATKGPELVALFREYGVIDVGTGPLVLPELAHLLVRYDLATGNAIAVTQLPLYSLGGRILTDGNGRVTRFQNNPSGYHVLQLDAQGKTEWEKNFPIGGGGGYSTALADVAQDAQGNIHFLGSIAPTTTIDIDGSVVDGSAFSGFLVKLSPAGELIWVKGINMPAAMAVDPNGQIALVLHHKKSNKAYQTANADGPIPEAATCTFECVLLATLDADGQRSSAQLVSEKPYVVATAAGPALDLGMANQHINVFHQDPMLPQTPFVIDVYGSATGGKLWDREIDFTATATSTTGAAYVAARYTTPFDFGDGLLDLPSSFSAGLAVVATSDSGQHLWARSFAWGSDYNPMFTRMVLPDTGGPVLAGTATTLDTVYIDGAEQPIPSDYTDLIVALKSVP